MEKQYLNVLNTFTNKYEIVEVSEKVYKEYMRSGWKIKDNDKSFFNHQIQISSLIGNQNDSYENFDEYLQLASDTEEEVFANLQLDALRIAMSELDINELKLIRTLYLYGMNERKCACVYGVSQKNINKKKRKILSKLNKLINKYSI